MPDMLFVHSPKDAKIPVDLESQSPFLSVRLIENASFLISRLILHSDHIFFFLWGKK